MSESKALKERDKQTAEPSGMIVDGLTYQERLLGIDAELNSPISTERRVKLLKERFELLAKMMRKK
jgi:hypothetical protein